MKQRMVWNMALELMSTQPAECLRLNLEVALVLYLGAQSFWEVLTYPVQNFGHLWSIFPATIMGTHTI